MIYTKTIHPSTMNKNFLKILMLYKVPFTCGVLSNDLIVFESSYTYGGWEYNQNTGVATQYVSFFIDENEKATRVRKFVNDDGTLVQIYEEII